MLTHTPDFTDWDEADADPRPNLCSDPGCTAEVGPYELLCAAHRATRCPECGGFGYVDHPSGNPLIQPDREYCSRGCEVQD